MRQLPTLIFAGLVLGLGALGVSKVRIKPAPRAPETPQTGFRPVGPDFAAERMRVIAQVLRAKGFLASAVPASLPFLPDQGISPNPALRSYRKAAIQILDKHDPRFPQVLTMVDLYAASPNVPYSPSRAPMGGVVLIGYMDGRVDRVPKQMVRWWQPAKGQKAVEVYPGMAQYATAKPPAGTPTRVAMVMR